MPIGSRHKYRPPAGPHDRGDAAPYQSVYQCGGDRVSQRRTFSTRTPLWTGPADTAHRVYNEASKCRLGGDAAQFGHRPQFLGDTALQHAARACLRPGAGTASTTWSAVQAAPASIVYIRAGRLFDGTGDEQQRPDRGRGRAHQVRRCRRRAGDPAGRNRRRPVRRDGPARPDRLPHAPGRLAPTVTTRSTSSRTRPTTAPSPRC